MSQELKELLRSVLQEELKPVHDRLERLEGAVGHIRQDVSQLQQDVSQLQKDVTQLQQGQQTLEHEMAGMKQMQERILEELRISKHNQSLILNDVTGIRKSVDVTVSYLQRRSDVMFDKLIDHEKEILNLKSKMPN
ncbi:hypothetical protein M493_17355 [Geobacillus genomosp. 3]|uniref:Uncharacterized protein n=1 Tax=Geobacillus genomosp. 3 TaxID=1921421 RepID=S5Z3Q2_GEOG3|nr:hypothetical protein [Geobacillus genomosp. 3]AGT33679.1 hypothetical protein M493_17355 [Geobacillus genomosp. 3]